MEAEIEADRRWRNGLSSDKVSIGTSQRQPRSTSYCVMMLILHTIAASAVTQRSVCTGGRQFGNEGHRARRHSSSASLNGPRKRAADCL